MRSTDCYSVTNRLRRVHIRIALHVLGSVQMEHRLFNPRVPNDGVACKTKYIPDDKFCNKQTTLEMNLILTHLAERKQWHGKILKELKIGLQHVLVI